MVMRERIDPERRAQRRQEMILVHLRKAFDRLVIKSLATSRSSSIVLPFNSS
jgi:hypothetical protein